MSLREGLGARRKGARRRIDLAFDALRLRRSLDTLGEDDFVETVYLKLLGRIPDSAGKAHYAGQIHSGRSRTEVVIELARSDEFMRRAAAKATALPSIIEQRPDQYQREDDNLDWRSYMTFQARDGSDFDWLERQITKHGFYERPGVWSMEVNLDKRVVAEMISLLGPKTTLEVGCANGAVMQCLRHLGVAAEGVDISATSRNSAPMDLRPHIHLADLGDTQLDIQVDVLYGLDIFEHINPNRLDAFLKGCFSHMAPGGLFFTNTPAFGEDEVFGTAFHPYLPSWDSELESGFFHCLVTDEQGFPENGHLVWATARWWDKKFRSHGLVRETEIERALHSRYDSYINETSPARRSIFIYSAQGDTTDRSEIVSRIKTASLATLDEYARSAH